MGSQLSPTSSTDIKNSAIVANYLTSAVRSGESSSTASLDPHFQPPTPQPMTYSGPDPHGKRHPIGIADLRAHTAATQAYGSLHRPPYGTYNGQRYYDSSLGSSEAPGGTHTQSRARQMSTSKSAIPESTTYVPSATGISHVQHTRSNSYQDMRVPNLPPPGAADGTTSTHAVNPPVTTTIPDGVGTMEPISGIIDASIAELESMAAYALPIFGGETLNRSPFAMGDDFTSWLFNENTGTTSSIAYSMPGMVSGFSDPISAQFQNQYYPSDAAFDGYIANVLQHQQMPQQQQQQHPMSVTSILDSGPPQSVISEDKRNELIYLMQSRFNEADHTAVKKRKETFFEGNMDADNHILGTQMIQAYIASYWRHFDEQAPILHKPTFTADKTPNLLLLIVIAIGAVTLDKDHGTVTTDAAAELSHFIAWHLRWEIFQDVDFRPPAKLWVFQTLLLLELYEKLYSTRALHERAHIHHDTTLTLMRRGSSLLGRSAFESPPSAREDRYARSMTGSRANSASEPGAGEESWNHWIKAEATRRVAFAAFTLDSTHATMFGHSAKMVAHEMRLPLPCDEALWSATSAAEVARVQSSLHSNGVRSITFLDALKKTLNGQKVRTNPFGRTVIMAGLLSVSWHMNQRDLQASSLGVVQTAEGRGKWRTALLRAFDYWKRDFDEAASHSSSPSLNCSPSYRQQYHTKGGAFYEARSVLHHLAHMASHVDIVDCQIFAGAGRLLGRSITPRDYSTAREKMTQHWATKSSARDATFYALKFLSDVLMPDNPWRSNIGSPMGQDLEYAARDDVMLSRPWVLYYAALVVWCYGYAHDGPITPSPPELHTPAQQRQDMYIFLHRFGAVRTPDHLNQLCDRNRCMGLLMVLRDMFMQTRWELLQEAATLLGSCIEKLKGTTSGNAVVAP